MLSLRTFAVALSLASIATAVACSTSTSDPTPNTPSTSKTDAGDLDAGPDPETDASAAGRVTINAEDYDQECTTADDCIAVFSGNVCNPCLCPNAAVAKTMSTDYTKAIESAQKQCPAPPGAVDCAPCEELTLTCPEGTKRCAIAPFAGADGG